MRVVRTLSCTKSPSLGPRYADAPRVAVRAVVRKGVSPDGRRFAGPSVSRHQGDSKAALATLEQTLDVTDICFYRSIAEAQLKTQQASAPSAVGWVINTVSNYIWGGANASAVGGVLACLPAATSRPSLSVCRTWLSACRDHAGQGSAASSSPSSLAEPVVVSEADRKMLYDTIDYDETAVMAAEQLPKEASRGASHIYRL